MYRSSFLLIPFCAVVASCSGEAASSSSSVVVDSAGIRVVTNGGPRWDEGEGWRVETEPLVTFGSRAPDGSDDVLLPAGAIRLSGGQVVIGDQGANNLKVFSADGSLEEVIGRIGDGPGEFRYFYWVKACGGDSIFTYDGDGRETAVFSPVGELARTMTVHTAETGRPPFELVCNRSGVFLTSGWGPGRIPEGTEPYRKVVPVSLSGRDGSVRAVLGEFPGTEMMHEFRGATPRRMGRWLRLALTDSLAWVADNETPELLVYDLGGELQMIVRTPGAERPVTDEDLAWHREVSIDSALTPSRRERVQRQLDTMEPPESLPPVVMMLADADGAIWVQRYPYPGEAQGKWDVYAPDGVLLGRVAMPEGLSPYEIGHDYVLGVAEAPDGAQTVRLHRLLKAGAPTS